jgi:hypothetical protein
MRKLLVALSAVLMVGTGAVAAHAQAGKFCPTRPGEVTFEAPFGPFPETMDGITNTGEIGNPEEGSGSLTFTTGDQIVIDAICVKAGRDAPVFQNFEADGSMTIGSYSITYSCTFPGGIANVDNDPGNELVGPCTITITTARRGISHITFYTIPYVAPESAQVQVLGAVETEGGAQGGAVAGGGLAFTGAQITILVLLLGALLGAGGLALAAGRRRASRPE